MENLKDILIDLSDSDEQDELIANALEKAAISAVKQAAKEVKGIQGERGLQGEKGDKGDTGEKGQRGAKGDIGIRGLRGEKGERGERGTKGEDGESVVLEDVVEKVLPDVLKRFPQGGGSMNRQTYINNADPLTRYTDLNIKAGSNVTITYQNNDTTKKVDVTFSATGGGGGGGIARSINNISTSTVAGSTSATDYVYLCTGTLTVTMPDATLGNTNLYTIKNVGTGVVTINTTSAQTIDNNASIQLGTQYTSVDLESDTANWNIT